MAKRGINGLIMRGYGAKDYVATVTQVVHITPQFVRVRMVAPELLAMAYYGPTAFLRFWFPDPVHPDTEQQRAYTFSEYDLEAGTFAVDFVLHEPAGPASTWAKQAKPGVNVSVTSLASTRFDLPETLPEGYLLFGDAASITSVNHVLGVIPPDIPVELYMEQHDPGDLDIPMDTHPKLVKRWVQRTDPTSLSMAVEARDWSGWYAWAACETGTLTHIRSRLLKEFAFPKRSVSATGYWKERRAFGANRTVEDSGKSGGLFSKIWDR